MFRTNKSQDIIKQLQTCSSFSVDMKNLCIDDTSLAFETNGQGAINKFHFSHQADATKLLILSQYGLDLQITTKIECDASFITLSNEVHEKSELKNSFSFKIPMPIDNPDNILSGNLKSKTLLLKSAANYIDELKIALRQSKTTLRQAHVVLEDEDGSREIAVIKGIPYYLSTGQNSGIPGVWFPLLFIQGTKPHNYDALPSYLLKERIKESIDEGFFPEYLLKFETAYCAKTCETGIFKGINPYTDQLASRIPTKETAITSARLSGHKFPRERLGLIDLTPEEKELTMQPIILEEKPIFVTNDPDEVNAWLVEQNATIACAVFSHPVSQNSKAKDLTIIEESKESESPLEERRTRSQTW